MLNSKNNESQQLHYHLKSVNSIALSKVQSFIESNRQQDITIHFPAKELNIFYLEQVIQGCKNHKSIITFDFQAVKMTVEAASLVETLTGKFSVINFGMVTNVIKQKEDEELKYEEDGKEDQKEEKKKETENKSHFKQQRMEIISTMSQLLLVFGEMSTSTKIQDVLTRLQLQLDNLRANSLNIDTSPMAANNGNDIQYATATLDAGNMREEVRLPQGVDFNEWLAVHTVDFFNEISLIYGIIKEYCTNKSCPVMSAGPGYEYLWMDGVQYQTHHRCPAPEHIILLMSWIDKTINDSGIFPIYKHGVYPTNFIQIVKTILLRIMRVLGILYIL